MMKREQLALTKAIESGDTDLGNSEETVGAPVAQLSAGLLI